MQPTTQDTLTPQVKQTVLALLRSALWGQERFPFQSLPDTDWKAVYTELRHHRVQYLPLELMVTADPAHALRYIDLASMNIRKWHFLMLQQQQICQRLAQAEIPCVVLKGTAAARYYPQPEQRCMGDIDFLVPPGDFDRALAQFEAPWEVTHEDPRHTDIRGENVMVELHRKFSSFRSSELCEALDGIIYEGTANAETCTVCGFPFPCLPPVANGLVLLTHINSHMEQGLGLRQILDWMMYVDQELDDAVWHRDFAPIARKLKLEKLAVTLTRMCQLSLGLREDITWCREAEEDLCQELLDHTFRQGNFGRKLPKKINLAVGFFSTTRSIPGFFQEMQRRGMITWPAAQKHPILRPFAWIYQLFRYLRLGSDIKHPIRYLFQAFRAEKKQGSLLDRLEVSRMNNDL